jgi:hypothetical protein
VIGYFGSDPIYNFISQTFVMAYSTDYINEVFKVICENSSAFLTTGFERKTKEMVSRVLVYLFDLAHQTGNSTLYIQGITSLSGNKPYQPPLTA